jgi:hypothetical protein
LADVIRTFFNIAQRVEFSTRGDSPSPDLAAPKLGAGAERRYKAEGLRPSIATSPPKSDVSDFGQYIFGRNRVNPISAASGER